MTNFDSEWQRSDRLDPRVRLASQLETDGGDPTFLFTIIENMIERQAWLTLPASRNDSAPVGSFRRLMEAEPPVGCGLTSDRLRKILELPARHERMSDDDPVHQKMQALRATVRRLLLEDTPVWARTGEIGNGRSRSNNITPTPTRGTDPEYILGRLKRDNPDIARRVIDGEISANAAAIEAGIYPAKISVNLKDMCSAARTLASRLDADQIDDLIAELQKHRG